MNIYQSICNVLTDVDFIGKDKYNKIQNFKYRGVDQVLNTLHPLFAKHHIFCIPQVLEVVGREERDTKGGGILLYSLLKIKYTFFAEDGTSVESIVIGEAMDTADKSMNKAMSVAFKYACFQTLCIPTEETTMDPDEQSFDVNGKKSGNASPAKTPVATEPFKAATAEQWDEVKNFGGNPTDMAIYFKVDNVTKVSYDALEKVLIKKRKQAAEKEEKAMAEAEKLKAARLAAEKAEEKPQ